MDKKPIKIIFDIEDYNLVKKKAKDTQRSICAYIRYASINYEDK